MDAELRRKAEVWIAEDPDPVTRAELGELLAKDDETSVADRFAGRLEFGTAGLRGVLGAGPNRMNRAVVVRTTAGLAAYLKEHVPDVAARGVVIGCDGRHLSREAASDTASVLAGHGIPARIFAAVAPTPLTAYAVTRTGAAAGVMVTASHNPPEYNGYKVYWSNGAQIIPPHDKGISAAIDRVGPLPGVPRLSEADARSRGLWLDMHPEVTEDYAAAVHALAPAVPGTDQVTVVYTALHGVGGPLATRALREAGFANVHPVPEQQEPDGAFPTVRFPNPEEPGAMDLSLALARKTFATLVLANDPDADRLAVAVPDPGGGYRMLTGNQVGVLLAGWLLDRSSGDRLVITTIVSSPMLGHMARAQGVRYAEVLTGFKWIANKAMELEKATGARFVMGYEEALGYSVGTLCRDKDGIGAAAVFARIAADAAARGTTILGELEALYRRFGLFVSRQVAITMKGADGQRRIEQIMEAFRAGPPVALGGRAVVATRDYLRGIAIRPGGGTEKLDLPPSNVLAYELEGGGRVTLRPSGTEPKIKYYFDLREEVRAGELLSECDRRASAGLDRLAHDFGALADSAAS